MIGLVRQAMDVPERFPEGLFMAFAADGDDVVGAAVMSLPLSLVLSAWPPEALPLLIDALGRPGGSLGGVFGPRAVAKSFAQAYCRAYPGLVVHPKARMRLYQIDEVVFSGTPPSGRVRRAVAEDFDVALSFAEAFYRSAGDERFDAVSVVSAAISDQRLFFWENKYPVSMAAWIRDTPRTKAIALVYTPYDERGRGYATALVSAVTRRALDDGKQSCVLFADSDNATANAIYRRVGYQPLGEHVHLLFEPLPL